MKILVVDDERLARLELRRLLADHPVEVLGEADRVEDALALAVQLRPDLVFLDVQMRGETGFEFLERLGTPAPRVVLVTAHEGFAMRGFECNVLDYLLKPVRPTRLAETLRRARVATAPRSGVEVGEVGRQAAFTVIKAAGASRLVPWYDLVSVQAEGNYTRVGLRDGTHCLVLRPLKQWLALAPAGAFVQVHRNALVRVDWIRALHAGPHGVREIVLADGVSLPVGRAHWPELKVRLEQGGMPGSSPL